VNSTHALLVVSFDVIYLSRLVNVSVAAENITLPAARWLEGFERTDPDLLLNFTAWAMQIATLATWLEHLFPGQILVPTSK
jgi:hypothetical protein